MVGLKGLLHTGIVLSGKTKLHGVRLAQGWELKLELRAATSACVVPLPVGCSASHARCYDTHAVVCCHWPSLQPAARQDVVCNFLSGAIAACHERH